MSKLFWSTLLITSVTTGFSFIPIARSQTAPRQTAPVPHTLSQFPLSPNPQVEPPVCFFTSTGGRTFDLESLCGASNPSNNATDANNPSATPLNTPSDNSPSNNSPSNNSPIISSPGQTGGETDLGPLTKPAINLPNVPPSAFSPGGVAPTRQSIDGNTQK